jgi:hypothetical protein
MWQSFKECHYVESREGIQYYKSLNDLSSKKTK